MDYSRFLISLGVWHSLWWNKNLLHRSDWQTPKDIKNPYQHGSDDIFTLSQW